MWRGGLHLPIPGQSALPHASNEAAALLVLMAIATYKVSVSLLFLCICLSMADSFSMLQCYTAGATLYASRTTEE